MTAKTPTGKMQHDDPHQDRADYGKEVDGLEATRQLRNRPETRELPIILVSAKTSGTNQEAAKKAGADAFLQKPFKRKDLIEILTRTLSQAGGRLPT